MYSIVLMMALTTGGEAPDCHRHSCDGGSGSTCNGGGCHGGGLFHRRNHCNGGGCTGSVACYGSVPAVAMAALPAVATAARDALSADGTEARTDQDARRQEARRQETGREKADRQLRRPGQAHCVDAGRRAFTIDNYTSPAKSDTHIIVSSPLSNEETKTYVLKAEVVRDGKVRTMEQSITVRAGEEAKVTLSLPTVVAAR